DTTEQLAGLRSHRPGRRIVQTYCAEETAQDDLRRCAFRIDIDQPRRLHEPDRFSQRRQVRLTEKFAEHAHSPLCRPELREDDARQRALAAAVGPEDRRALAGNQSPVDASKNPSASDPHAYVFKLDGWLPVVHVW